MADTGGLLNVLNGKKGISAPYNSVSVMKLIKNHHPQSKDELVDLIKYHYENDCDCGIKSQGTIEDFGKNLYDAQESFWGEKKFSLRECIQWEYNLFVINSLHGGIMEKKAIKELDNTLIGYQVNEAEGYLDEDLRIDLVVNTNEAEVCGIQVKPSTFLHIRQEVITFNKEANEKWDKPVFYLYYDKSENFENIDEVIEKIKNT